MGLWCKKVKEWLNQLGLKIVESTGDVKSKYFLIQRKTWRFKEGTLPV